MPSLQDFLDGKAKVTPRTSITFKGQVYRGKQILELAKTQLGESEVKNGQDSEPAAKPKRTYRRRRKAAEPKPEPEQPADSDES